MKIAITYHWADDLIPDHRQRIVDMCLTIEEAQTSSWLLPIDVGCDAMVGPTLVFDTDRSWETVAADIEAEGYSVPDFHAVFCS